MRRLILVPQYPTPMRYQEWWYHEFISQLSSVFEVEVLGDDYPDNIISKSKEEMFSPIKESINFENYQIWKYNSMELRHDDILLLNDISFPGLFSNVLYHKKPKHCYAICHATSKNAYDYFSENERSKWKVETGNSILFNKVFVATKYHKELLGWDNTVVTALPKHVYTRYNDELKENLIVSVSRPTPQKVDSNLEAIIEKEFDTKIVRNSFDNWEQYYKFLGKSKCLFISSSAETFGYQVLDAVYNNCVPVSPRNFSYPELLADEYLYSDKDEAIYKIKKVLNGELKVPSIKCKEQIDKFYETIIREMNK
jgi:hypothetical protein